MGMRGYVTETDVEIVDLEGLKEFRDKVLKWELGYEKFKPDYDSDELKEGCHLARSIKLKCEAEDEEEWNNHFGKNNEVYFQWDDWKINGYWYDSFVMFIRDLAPFIEGEVHIDCEEAEQWSKIYWENGACRLEIGIIEWNEHTPDSLKEKSKGESNDYAPMDPWVKKKQFLRGGQ